MNSCLTYGDYIPEPRSPQPHYQTAECSWCLHLSSWSVHVYQSTREALYQHCTTMSSDNKGLWRGPANGGWLLTSPRACSWRGWHWRVNCYLQSLLERIFEDQDLRQRTKLWVDRAAVVSAPLCMRSEIPTRCKNNATIAVSTISQQLRWKFKQTSINVFFQANILSIEVLIIHNWLYQSCHFVHMLNTILSKTDAQFWVILEKEITRQPVGKVQGHSQVSPKECNISTHCWESLACD